MDQDQILGRISDMVDEERALRDAVSSGRIDSTTAPAPRGGRGTGGRFMTTAAGGRAGSTRQTRATARPT